MKQGNLARDTRKLTREEFRILRFIVEREKPSRYEVQELSPWGSSKTDAVLKSLSGKNFILTCHDKTGAKGRNPNVYAANPRLGFFIGAELNICHDRFVLTDFIGQPLVYREFPPCYAEPDILSSLADHILVLAEQGRIPLNHIKGVALGLHKQIGERAGGVNRILYMGKLIELNIGRDLEKSLGIPVYVGSKRFFVLLREYLHRLTEMDELILNAHMEYGISLGIFENGEYRPGFTGMSGQIGHLIVPENRRRCYCGNVGCLRTLVSFQAICIQAREDLERGMTSSIDPSRLQGPDFHDGAEHIIDKALENDKLCINLIHNVGRYLGTALASAITILNPRRIIIHSNFVRAGDIFTAPVKLNIQRNTLDASIGQLEIDFAALKPYTVAEGGALFALKKHLDSYVER